MVAVRRLNRASLVMLLSTGAAVWYACSDRSNQVTDPSPAPALLRPIQGPDLRVAINAQQRHNDDLLKIPGVVGTAVGLTPDGRVGVQVLLERSGVAGVPLTLDDVPVASHVIGRVMAFTDPTTRRRPAPMGFSVGHPQITAGTIGARVRDATGRVFILSNNHVLANSNGATIGDPEYQPGPFDGGTAADQIATLSDFQTIMFGSTTNNTMDAAIALSSTTALDNAVPSDDGYGMPSSHIYGDANNDGLIDDRNALLGLNVQKYGRTTRLTHGQITGVNATILVCYEASGFTCTKSARYVDQLIISPAGFSGGGDSGSLIVTDDANKNPVALLFAGSNVETIANRIDLVLNRFGVTIDGAEPPPPGPFTDIAVVSVSAPAPIVIGRQTSVTVSVRNFGNQDVPGPFAVTLQDSAATVRTVGTQPVNGLLAGGSTTLTFAWTPPDSGDHTLIGRQNFPDDRPGNDRSGVTVTAYPPVMDLAITALSAPGNYQGRSINVSVTVGNIGNQNVTGDFTVTLRDATDNVVLGTQTIPGLNAGLGAVMTFPWNTTSASVGIHTLVASHSFTDDSVSNNQRSAGVTIRPRFTDISLTSITGPGHVAVGNTATVGATISNVGDQDVTATLSVVLTDGTTSGTLGTQNVPGLAKGASATLSFSWNTTGAAISGHTLFARQMLADDSAANDARAIGVIVDPPANPPTDIAITNVTAPSAVSQGTAAIIGVTVQNIGQQNVGASFNVVLTDGTSGIVIGTQTVTGLAIGASTTLTFSWTTTTAAAGAHTLVASHNFADDNSSNNQRSATVTVNARLTDIALTSLTGPVSVGQGSIASIGVTVQNQGEQDVASSFNVVLTDGTAGTPIGTQAVPGLALGATATLAFPWNTTGAALNGHILIARQMLADGNTTNDSRAIAVNVVPPVTTVTDIAVTGVNAAASVSQGKSVSVLVTLGNVGDVSVGAGVSVTLFDATDNVTLGTQTVGSLAKGASTTLTYAWSTTNASLGGHTLVASHNLNDNNAANNQRTTTVAVNPKAPDVAVSNVSVPGSVTQGAVASIGVTVQNVGDLPTGSSFDVVLTDASAGVVIGTQTVSGLPAGAGSTLTYSWNTATSNLGSHTLTATHTFTDGNTANNQRSATVTVNPKITDIALTGITGPASVPQGNTATIGVTVQNVGQQTVTASFNVVLTDASAGVTIGTQAVPGLAVGATATLTFLWNTAGVATSGHILIARQMLADADPTNNSRAVAVGVNPPSIHVGNLAGSTVVGPSTWSATVEITMHDDNHVLVDGATVQGNWSGGYPGPNQCTTGAASPGTCTITLAAIPVSTPTVSFAVSGAAQTGYTYKPSANHDPDGSSNGTTIFVIRL